MRPKILKIVIDHLYWIDGAIELEKYKSAWRPHHLAELYLALVKFQMHDCVARLEELLVNRWVSISASICGISFVPDFAQSLILFLIRSASTL